MLSVKKVSSSQAGMGSTISARMATTSSGADRPCSAETLVPAHWRAEAIVGVFMARHLQRKRRMGRPS